MLRLLFKSVVVLVLIVGIGNYLVYLKTGQMPLRDMHEQLGDNWFADLRASFSTEQFTNDAKQAVNDISSQYGGQEQAAPTTVYKWTDADGQVHFGDKPQNANAEQVEVKIQNAISAPVETQSDKGADAVNPQAINQQPMVNSALDKARAAAEAMQQRIQQQEQAQ
ncbi:DUF4124 domain-containing protein [Cellvibrio sp. pealriver]|uniref:DUF4124 domain-containing protein n=1 Tax=Cellvibrio sp. pealriver TaxID=1622269 RepID=UPI00066FC0A6|nr:DUF4124 domain-containing protein [Cellvibrio sp. pealriver]